MEWTDADAIAEVCLGNKLAFRVLVERHSGTVFRLAYLMSGNRQDAEDLVQETFLRAYKHLKRFDGERASFATWVKRICVNCSLNFIRARRNRKETRGEDTETFNWLEQVATPEPSPEQRTHSRQIAAVLGPALEMLSESERTAFVLRHYEGCPIEEIARNLHVQPNAAKQTLFRAVRKLRTALEPAWAVKR